MARFVPSDIEVLNGMHGPPATYLNSETLKGFNADYDGPMPKKPSVWDQVAVATVHANREGAAWLDRYKLTDEERAFARDEGLAVFQDVVASYLNHRKRRRFRPRFVGATLGFALHAAQAFDKAMSEKLPQRGELD